MDTHQTKLFIKVDGVIGDRKRICSFCNYTIEGAEKIVETTRKLRHGPYFPQLAYLQSSAGKIDTLGRAAVCLSCFHQLLRQWSAYEKRNVPVQRRTYKYISDKGVKNYQETRAFEIRTEAEKRAFAIYTKQEHIVKKSFERLTKILDAQEELVNRCDQRILELERELAHCTESEKWRIKQEVKKQEQIIKAAESRIDEEEDKEEEIRNETKALLDVYRKNSSLFRATSEPSLFSNAKPDLVIPEQDIDCFAKSQDDIVPRDSGLFDSVDGSPVKTTKAGKPVMAFNQFNNNHGHHKVTIVSQSLIKSETDIGYALRDMQDDRGLTGNVWDQMQLAKEYTKEHHTTHPDSEWHLVKEVIHPAESEARGIQDDVWSNLDTKKQRSESEEDDERHRVGHRENRSWKETHTDVSEVQGEQIREKCPPESELHIVKEVFRPVESEFQSLPEDVWSKLFIDENQSGEQLQNNKQVIQYDNWKQGNDATSQEIKVIYHGKHILTDRENRNLEEWQSATDDSEDEGEQMYVVNSEYGSTPRYYNTQINTEVNQVRGTSNDVYADPWDNIQFDINDHDSSHPKEDSSADEYDQESTKKEILSPGRLDSSRFNEFTKSSYAPLPVREQLSREKSREKVRHTPEKTVDMQWTKRETQVTVIDRRNKHVSQQERNAPGEPMANSRNLRGRHLSVEEEEWETKHLNPGRLDGLKMANFFNESPNDNVKKVESNSLFAINRSNGVYHDDKSNERSKKYYDSRRITDDDKKIEVKVERSPMMRKLMRQDDITVNEQPIQKTVTRRSLQSDPWNNLDERSNQQSSNRTELEGSYNDSTSDRTIAVGRLDLHRWSSEIEKNRVHRSSGEEKTYIHSTNEPRKIDGYFKHDPLNGSQIINDNVCVHKKIVISPLKENSKETVFIDEKETRLNEESVDISKRSIGRVDLGMWERNRSSQSNKGNVSSRVPWSSNAENHPTSPRKSIQNKIEDDGSFVYENKRTDPVPRINVTTRQSGSQNAMQPTNFNNDLDTSSHSPLFNQSMSEEELAWERRFNKFPDKNSSEDINNNHKIRRTVPDSEVRKVDETSRLENGNGTNDNMNYVKIGKISLDDDEVQSVRTGGKKRTPEIRSMGRKNVNRQTWSGFPAAKEIEHMNFADSSQLSEEEKAWEVKTSKPGKLDFSKFSQFR